jgi:Tfp pilus assembly protein PilF
MSQRTRVLLWLTGLVVLVLLAYRPALRAGFIWDDGAHVTKPELRTVAGLGRIWTEIGATQQYYPVLHSAFWIEHQLWGSNPKGYHWVNVAQHALAAVLLLALLRRLEVRGAMLAAAVFALHPVQVESVAWISEQKNTLSTVFYLAAAIAYLRFDAGRGRSAYFLALGFFVLALATKTVTATLPAALLVILWWRRGSLSWRRDVMPLVPWFLLALAVGGLTAWIERKVIGAEGAAFELTFLQRVLLAGHVVWFYAGKLIWPGQLTFIYPRWTIEPGQLADWLPLLTLVSLVTWFWWQRVRSKGPLAAVLLFGGTLFPVLGFFNVYPFQYSFVADHFQYLASIALIAAGANAFAILMPRLSRLSLAGPFLLVMALALQTYDQSRLYSDDRTLFGATLVRNPDAWMAHNNFAQAIMTRGGDRGQAIRHLTQAVALRPNYPEALNNLGLALTQSGRAAEGLELIERSLRLKPSLSEAHNNHGIALAAVGRGEEAAVAFRRAAALNPTFPNIHENLGKLLQHLGRPAEAQEHFAMARRLRETTGRR